MKQARAMRTRDQVLDAAAEEFALHGYAGTNLATVAVRTGMTKGALYGHFPSKKALADELVSQSTETWNTIGRSIAETACAPETALRALVLAVSRQMKHDIRFRAALRLAADCTMPAGGAPDLLDRIRREMAAAARDTQQQQAPYSPLATQPPDVVVHLLLTVAYGLSFAAERGAPGRSPATTDKVWELLLTALQLEEISTCHN
ncbi:TetR/AcrR family transcriptional regulator [Streptomyces rubrogriseus]|uniref:TetR/AcrR family transcriptional regulator n=2 Tax=Streptomyces violaceoruber group TaxID=2867121 RepID=A0A6G3TAE0_9ACTN|nr:TetR/AcrR family transcriptional regulator [Streptomyces rubrogriseus]BAC76314.1 putative lactone-dependent transcriptional regulator MmyR [Streptomyces violaceoruber]